MQIYRLELAVGAEVEAGAETGSRRLTASRLGQRRYKFIYVNVCEGERRGEET